MMTKPQQQRRVLNLNCRVAGAPYLIISIVCGATFGSITFLRRCGYSPATALQIIMLDPTRANWQYYFVPKGTSIGQLTSRLGRPDLIFLSAKKLHQACSGLSQGYKVPTKSPTGQVLYYAVADAGFDSYQIFYYFDEKGTLEYVFIGGEDRMFSSTY